jgi:serine/threonine protein kinase/formylglycine-generating enzyme required for sulfatase activity/dienelactone hydrolase
MGVVYRARDERLERDVAIKVLPTGVLHDEATRRRFRTEALALAKLSHPNIATVYDVGVQGGGAGSGSGGAGGTGAAVDYLVMELVPGQSLGERMKAGPLATREALNFCVQIAAALEEAHERGVVHRDLKPSNIMVTPKGHVKVLDFGLAKLLAPADSGDADATISNAETRGQIGTPLYMSPEQADGRRADVRTDLWSLGVVLYEMLTGELPFQGDSGFSILLAVVKETPKPVTDSRADLPEGVAPIIEKSLEKEVANRYQTAAEMSRDCTAVLTRLSVAELLPAETQDEVRVSRKRMWVGILVALIAAAGLGWFLWRSHRRDQANARVPRVLQLFEYQRPLSAYLLMKRIEGDVAGDARLAEFKDKHLRRVNVDSTPPGATVEIRDYLETEKSAEPHSGWYALGKTPLRNVEIPEGYFRWRVSKERAGQMVVAPGTDKTMTFDLSATEATPAGMVSVPAQEWSAMVDFVGWMGPYPMPAYFLDKFEVTNKEFQEFVDQGGYEKKEYWREQFERDGKELSRDEAMKLFRDRTGRAAPATWEGGHYPDGQADYPVTGVSWYEAAAYAAYAGKNLPVIAQWYAAAPDDFTVPVTQMSNFGGTKSQGPAAVGSFEGLGPFGTYDMAGNVQEWTRTATGKGLRVILGGNWNSQTYAYFDPAALSPFDRAPTNGFRCVKNVEALPEAALGPMVPVARDLSKAKPASDEVFRAYKSLYAYPKTPLNAKEEGVTEDKRDWRVEKVTFAPAYEGQRMIAYIFLPKNAKPPYQTVVFFPSARVVGLHDSKELGDVEFFDFIVQSGRAVIYPVYYNTYERTVQDMLPGTAAETTEATAQRYKDLARSIDYLETRKDFDVSKLGYLGVSMGAAEGVIYAELEDRIKTVVFLDGGFFLDQVKPGRDQVDFAPRLKKPVLMVNGRYDYVFSVERAQEPLFRALGAPDADKKHVVLDTPHEIVQQKDQMVKVVLDWLDKYLGPVR